MANTSKREIFLSIPRNSWILHSTRISVGAVVSLLVATVFGLPEAYWAAITTIIVMESTLGAAWTVSKRRFIGTALGAVLGGFVAHFFEPGVLVFGISLFAVGMCCAVLRLDRSAYRFAGITLAIVMLVGHATPPWLIAIHRFVEVSIGIAVGLAIAAVWPGRDAKAAG
jgi:uncharacterized membrane protein YccC